LRRTLVLLAVLNIFGFTSTKMENNELVKVREAFHRPVSKANIEEILSMPATGASTETIKAYQAVSRTMMAEFVTSPFSKLSYFKKGKNQLESIILENKSLETIYLRLLIQLNIPSLLGYYSKIESDLDYFCSNFESSEIDEQTTQLFKETLMKTEKIGEYPDKQSKLQGL
jgi:hypothetical protein